MRDGEAREVARLHRDGIATGFLSSLGIRFLSLLYRAMARAAGSFVLVACDENGRIIGFVAGTCHVGRMYRSILVRRGWLLGLLVFPRLLFQRSVRRRVLESIRHPAEEDCELPAAELLSIAVDPNAYGLGVASALVKTVAEELERRGCKRFKAIVGAGLHRARRFYEKCGFERAGEVESHGEPAIVYVKAGNSVSSN